MDISCDTMLKYLLSVICLLCDGANANREDQEPKLSCEAGWSQVGTDCLFFHEKKLTSSAAKAFCKKKYSQLIEFYTSEHLDQFSEWLKSSDYSVEKWWGGAEKLDDSLCVNADGCCWVWPESGRQLDPSSWKWEWGPSYPACGDLYDRYVLTYFDQILRYQGASVSQDDLNYSVCQKVSTSTSTTTINNSTTVTESGNEGDNVETSSTSSVPAIAGGSVAGFLLIVTIIIVGCWCWRTGKCPRRNDENVDENEMYGGQEDYYEFDNADCRTKVTDTNDMYDGDKNADEYDSD